MGQRGPIPARSDQRVRRNKPETPIETVTALGNVPIPELGLEDPHPLITDFYESLKHSAQSRYYEPSDWSFARFTLHFADKLVKSGKPSSQMLAAVNGALTELLVSEGSRRRVRIEIEREQAQNTVIDVADRFREMLAK